MWIPSQSPGPRCWAHRGAEGQLGSGLKVSDRCPVGRGKGHLPGTSVHRAKRPWGCGRGLFWRPEPAFHGAGRSLILQAAQVAVGCRKLTSPSPSSLLRAWDQSLLAPQRGSGFLRTAWALCAGPGGAGDGGRAGDRARCQPSPNHPVNVQQEGPLFLAPGGGSGAKVDSGRAEPCAELCGPAGVAAGPEARARKAGEEATPGAPSFPGV